MTGLDAWDEIVARLREEGFPPPTPERFMSLVNGKMRDLNAWTPVYWRRRVLATQANSRNLVVNEPVLGVIKGSITDPSSHKKKELTVKPGMQFSGVGHDTTADGEPDFPNCIWPEWDMNSGYTFLCFDPRPDKVYYCHLTLHYRVPPYTNPQVSLPVHELVHPIVVEGIMSDLTETDDFHMKSLHVEHLQMYIAGRDTARALVKRTGEPRRDVVDRFHARSSSRDETY